MSPRSAIALVVAAGLTLVGCSDGGAPDSPDGSAPPSSAAAPPVSPSLMTLSAATTVVPGTGATDLAVATSKAMFATAPVVVLAPVDDLDGQATAASLAVQLGVPLLLADPAAAAPAGSPISTTPPADDSASDATADPAAAADATVAELARLGTTTVLDVGAASGELTLPAEITVVPAPAQRGDLAPVVGVEPGADQPVATADLVGAVAALDPASPALLTLTDAADNGPSDAAPTGSGTPPEGGGSGADGGTLPAVSPAAPLADVLVLTTPDAAWVAATATARAAGARVQVAAGADPRTDAATVEALAQESTSTVVALGDVFGSVETLRYRLDVAATGVELPGGGQVLFPGRRMVALYGNPESASLGVLGEQPLDETITRAQKTAAQYDGLWGDEPVVPAFELIATVASASAGPDGNYSTELSVDDIKPYVDAARDAGIYVVLDLQPGRTDFLTQAKLYADLLKEPNVGLALDPEWRLKPNQVHLEQIGHVDAAEINSVVTWLADLTRDAKLPQKLLILHQFRLDMIENRDQVDTSRDELAVLIHADGNGPPGSKYATYGALTASPPPNVWWGWKNFYDEDSPTFTPEETVAVDPSPVFVSYQ